MTLQLTQTHVPQQERNITLVDRLLSIPEMEIRMRGTIFFTDRILTEVNMHRRKLPDVNIVQAQKISKFGYSPRSSSGVNIKPTAYDGKGSWITYHTNFDACSKMKGWTDNEQGLYLAVSLRGKAQYVLINMPNNSRENYNILV